MSMVIPLSEIADRFRPSVGGKAFALAALVRSGLAVPDGVCVVREAYEGFVRETGLRERILLELNRKPYEAMRWEEWWDASLRIRNLFLGIPLLEGYRTAIGEAVAERFGDRPVVVRSSSVAEDSARASFAGLHESYVNVCGTEAILDHVRLVWASLWSDGALLYRQELGLDVADSSMAVVIQELVAGQRSGVVFEVSPGRESEGIVEAVHGLNQGLVDGTVEPDRWTVDRASGDPLRHDPPARRQAMVADGDAVRLSDLPPEKAAQPPLDEDEVAGVYGLCRRAGEVFGAPQDVEWTIRDEQTYVLQSRPITMLPPAAAEDKRQWYLSLRRSYENLEALRRRIEDDLIPRMVADADALAAEDLASLSDAALADAIEARADRKDHWVGVYWRDFIPFAHGARLFGQVYNDAVRPADPYEFIDLLADTGMVSVRRNRMLVSMADRVRRDADLLARLEHGGAEADAVFAGDLDAFVTSFAEMTSVGAADAGRRDAVLALILEMAKRPTGRGPAGRADVEGRKAQFLSHFSGDDRRRAEDLLDLARASYRLRDDDNIYLGRIESELARAVREGRGRLRGRLGPAIDDLEPGEVARSLRDPSYRPEPAAAEAGGAGTGRLEMRARQLVGQPAGPGVAAGPARVVAGPSDLFGFKAGEVLVCDALDPNMTFVVPLAVAVVERRGGMLIHGAIIAREYGIPCVTGVPDAADLIHTGDRVTVDGYLGIVTVSSQGPAAAPSV
jgi:pyruvate,water dikinase